LSAGVEVSEVFDCLVQRLRKKRFVFHGANLTGERFRVKYIIPIYFTRKTEGKTLWWKWIEREIVVITIGFVWDGLANSGDGIWAYS
jgi:hypothetical protein